MICPGCKKPYFFIIGRKEGKCLKCGHTSEFALPAYTPAYHLDKYGSTRTLKTDPMMGQVVDLLKISGPDSILEIGCGAGDYSREVSRICDYVGIDLSIQTAAGRFKNRFLEASGEELPFRDAAFDKALSINVIEHVLDPKELLFEIRRVLRPGGTLVIATPDIGFFLSHLTLDETHLHAWGREEFERLVSQFFDITDIRHAGSLFKYYPLNLALSRIIRPDLLITCKKPEPQDPEYPIEGPFQ